ncbi:putative tail protein [Vibrio phage VCPH]|nr:putative tail protein [Vibrio phage VCPH]
MSTTVGDLFGGDALDPAQVKSAYESNADTNAFTDSEKNAVALVNDVGTYPGDTISDNVDLATALGELEAKIEEPTAATLLTTFFSQRPFATNETLGIAVCAVPYTIPANMPESGAYADVAPTDAMTLAIKKNGTTFGTVTFTAGNKTGTIDSSVDTSFAVGDRLELVYNGDQDDTVDGLTVTIKGEL